MRYGAAHHKTFAAGVRLGACMPSYEYKTLEIDTGMFGSSSVPTDELNDLGADGWEVVAPITENSGQTAGLLLQRER